MRTLRILVLMEAIWTLFVEAEPQFDDTSVNVTAIKGQPAVLPCTVLNKEVHQIIWMNPKRILISTEDRRVIDDTRMSIERPFVRDWNLHIRNVQTYDDGEYTCQINTDPILIKRIRLKVHVPAEIDNATSSGDITTTEGKTVKLTCEAKGIPVPTVTWYRKTLQTQVREQVGEVGEVLIIYNISRYCGGMYECEASNNIAQPVNRLMSVDVEFPPEVMFRTPRKIGQERGKEMLLECFVTAAPHGVSQWKKNGKSVAGQNTWKYRTEIYRENSFTIALYLRIINMDVDDFGTYTCEAYNNFGKDSDYMDVYEYFKPTTPLPRIYIPETPSTPLDVWSPTDTEIDNGNLNDQGYALNRNIQSSRGSNINKAPYSGHVGVGQSYGAASHLTSQKTVLIFLQTTLLFLLPVTLLTLPIIYTS